MAWSMHIFLTAGRALQKKNTNNALTPQRECNAAVDATEPLTFFCGLFGRKPPLKYNIARTEKN